MTWRFAHKVGLHESCHGLRELRLDAGSERRVLAFNGYSYRSIVPGPIGIVLAPGRDAAAHRTLPFASSLCGSCTDVCPVRIDLHHEILAWRQEIGRRELLSLGKRAAMRLLGWLRRIPYLYRLLGWLARRVTPILSRAILDSRWTVWGKRHELPPMPRQSFRALYRRRRGRA